jgi:NADH-quinone oxidoreductase subunit J
VDLPLSPVLLYGGCALGAVGVALALPRPRVSAFVVGAIVAAAALGAVLLGLGLKNPGAIPNYHFYIFSVIALGAALRVISHPRPVYAALYFVLTILASCGLYLLLSAEFLAFALVIVYAGAILITYLFVIMLATEGPTADAVEAMNEYDRVSREPVLATIAGFIILGALTTAMATGVTGGAGKGEAKLTANTALMTADKPLALMPKKIEKVLREAKDKEGKALLAKDESLAIASDQVRDKLVSENRIRAEQWVEMMPRTGKGEPAYAVRTSAAGTGEGWVVVKNAKGDLRVIPESDWPKGLELTGTEGVAFNLIDGHPGAIEIAGVILLMAMLGAVVLARKKVEMDESAKAEAAARLKQHTDLGVHLGEEAEFVPPSVGGEPVGAGEQPAGGTR